MNSLNQPAPATVLQEFGVVTITAGTGTITLNVIAGDLIDTIFVTPAKGLPADPSPGYLWVDEITATTVVIKSSNIIDSHYGYYAIFSR